MIDMDKLSVYFNRSEFACKDGCGFDTVDAKLLEILRRLREYYGVPVSINSACRCKEHNKEVGGQPSSQHLKGKAADIVVKEKDPAEIASKLEEWYPDTCGIGRYGTFTHIDCRSEKARWDYTT